MGSAIGVSFSKAERKFAQSGETCHRQRKGFQVNTKASWVARGIEPGDNVGSRANLPACVDAEGCQSAGPRSK